MKQALPQVLVMCYLTIEHIELYSDSIYKSGQHVLDIQYEFIVLKGRDSQQLRQLPFEEGQMDQFSQEIQQVLYSGE